MTERLRFDRRHALHGAAATRRLEAALAGTVPPHALMDRAGSAVARLALALAPHARTPWIACGPGNNGGDGLEAAAQWVAMGRPPPVVTWLGDVQHAPAAARRALARAQAAGAHFAGAPPALGADDLAIDALLGLGARPLRAGSGLADTAQRLASLPCPVLAVDLPTGLDADTGRVAMEGIAGRAIWERPAGRNGTKHTLALLTLKPGLFTAAGRDTAGSVWFDDLGLAASGLDTGTPTAWLAGEPKPRPRPHAAHKGSHGDVAVLGGAPGMVGAAVLAAHAALHGGAERVLLALLDPVAAPQCDAGVMRRSAETLPLQTATVVCGCGGGSDADSPLRPLLPRVLRQARALVLDADGLNVLATDPSLAGLLRARPAGSTVLTPHPLEAARLLGLPGAADVQADRLAAARALAERYACVVVLKGSGTVVAAPDAVPRINPTGDAKLAVGGTGDVLAGLLGARWAGGLGAFDAACAAVYEHGAAADAWPPGRALTAARLAAALDR